MDIAAINSVTQELTVESASAFTQARTADQVKVAVAKKVMDQQRAQGDAAVELIQAAASVGKQSGCSGCDIVA